MSDYLKDLLWTNFPDKLLDYNGEDDAAQRVTLNIFWFISSVV
jgi:hypothetical protein